MQEIWARWREVEAESEKESKDEEMQEIWKRWRDLEGSSDENEDEDDLMMADEEVGEEWVVV